MPCPPVAAWTSLAAGLSDARETDRLLNHASDCDTCAEELRAANEAVNGHEQPPDAMTLDAGALAARMASSGHSRGFLFAKWRRIAAGAVLAAAVGSGAFWWKRLSERDPLVLLAKAYSSHRTLELRMADAAYAPLRAERGNDGSGAQNSTDWLEAQAILKHRTNVDAIVLHARGRAEILAWRPAEAIVHFQAASKLGARSPDFLLDFATAHFQLGEQTHTPSEYAEALEMLDSVLRERPNFEEALYNRAIVRSRMRLARQAHEDLERFLNLTNDPGWRGEAQRFKLIIPDIR